MEPESRLVVVLVEWRRCSVGMLVGGAIINKRVVHQLNPGVAVRAQAVVPANEARPMDVNVLGTHELQAQSPGVGCLCERKSLDSFGQNKHFIIHMITLETKISQTNYFHNGNNAGKCSLVMSRGRHS